MWVMAAFAPRPETGIVGATASGNAGSSGIASRAPIRGIRKAAILLTSVGDRIGAEILRTMAEEEVHDLTREISLLAGVTDEERNQVLNEFLQVTQSPHFIIPGGVEYATSVLMAAFGPDAGKRMAERLMKSIGNETPMVDSLRKADPQHLAKIVHREHPQTIALILCHLGTSHAAILLSALPAKLRTEVTRRMAALDQISPEVINKLAKTVYAKLRLVGESSLESCGGVRAVAEVLNRVDSTTSEDILTTITEEDSALAGTIRQLMFVFEDLLRVSLDELRIILGKVDRKVLTLSLKGCSPQVKKNFKGVLSSRAAEMLEEDLQALGPVRIRDVQTAQQHIIDEARKLQTEGKISLQPSATDEFVE